MASSPMRLRRRLATAVTAATVVLAGVAIPATAGPRPAPAALRFDAPVALTPSVGFGGYEPAVLADPRGGVWVAAHKANEGDAASPDPGSADSIRGSSWLWWSGDGRRFVDAPAGALGIAPRSSDLFFGDENAVAADDAGHVYAVDTSLTDASVTRWSLAARRSAPPTFDFFRPVIPAGEAYDDRPWIAAHGNGVVAFVGNTWEQDAYPGDPTQPSRGASIVHMSYDGGLTFDPVGQPLDGSGWCRPAADHRHGSRTFFAICTTSSSATRFAHVDLSAKQLVAFVSADDGRTWRRYPVGHYDSTNPNTSNWPSVAVGTDGTVYAAYVDQSAGGAPVLSVYRSTTSGRTWSHETVTWPDADTGIPLYSVAVSPRGAIGLAVQDQTAVWATVGAWGRPLRFVRVPTGKAQQNADGDFTQCAFTSAGKLAVTWTALRPVQAGPVTTGLDSDVYFSLQS